MLNGFCAIFKWKILEISTLATMIQRQIEKYFKWVTLNFPIVIVLGPRQSGKTAFVRDMFSKHAYINLEDESHFKLAKENPADFFKQHPTPIILDEAQRLPKLLSMIKILTNNSDPITQFILICSHLPTLPESLAKRTGIVHLLPF